MDRDGKTRKEQGRRLAAARLAAGYRSARAAALDNEWAESSYRAHEAGGRTIGQDDAERYAKRYAAEGVSITAEAILFDPAGPAPRLAPDPDVQLVPKISWVAASKMSDTGDALDPAEAPKIATSDLPTGDWFALKVSGDSMNKIAPDGSVILINQKEQKLVNGAYYVFGDRGAATFKQYASKPIPMLMPCSSNDVHKPIIPTKHFQVVGRVRRVLVDL